MIPHLTIGTIGTIGHAGNPQALRADAGSVRPRLPIEAAATVVILMAGPRPGTPGMSPGQRRTIATFSLG